MQKPQWRVRSSSYIVESPYLRLRKDAIELPDGTILPEYYVRESDGFVIVLALTHSYEAVLIEQYRYGTDSIVMELPAGTIDRHEDPLHCAQRELAEETGYRAPRWEHVITAAAEPVRSNALMHCFIAFDAVRELEPTLDPSEHIEVRLWPLIELPALLASGRIASVSSIAAAYAALARLG